MRRKVKKAINFTRSLLFRNKGKTLHLISSDPNDAKEKKKINEIIKRINYFDQSINIELSNKITPIQYIDHSLIGITDSKFKNKLFNIKLEEFYNFDFDTYRLEGWHYHKLLSKIYDTELYEGISYGQELLRKLTLSLSKDFSKSYIFGTGPSLEKAINIDWSDGIRIVSNTIVKDKEIWKHIKPHFIVAGDGIYHFGFSKFAENFRKDLKECLSLTETYFIIPAIFYHFCVKELPQYKNRIIPIPHGSSKKLHVNFNDDYRLPGYGNVLPLLLIPLACTLTKNINLWGFDGRSPNDKLFWKNSSKHFYSDHVEELMKLHPVFFEELVPKNAPESYAKKVHGEILDIGLSKAEENGYKFNMLHHSYTGTLMKRYVNNKK